MSICAVVGAGLVWYLSYTIYRCLVEPKLYGNLENLQADRPRSRLPLVETSCSPPEYASGKYNLIFYPFFNHLYGSNN